MNADLIVGIAPLGHDLSVTIARADGTVLIIGEEERYSRIKGGEFVFLPSRLEAILAEVGAGPCDVAVLAPAGNPLCSVDETAGSITYPPSARSLHMQAWVQVYRKLLSRAEVRPPLRHHRAHAASSYYASEFRQAAVVTIDGHGDGECCTISIGDGSTLRLLERQTVPESVAYLYRAVATYVGLRGHEREGKLMALAAYGQPVLANALSELFFDHLPYPARATARIHERPCRVNAWVALLTQRFGSPRQPGSPLTVLEMNLAASAQQVFSVYVMSVLRRAHAITGIESCCAAGGAFVNSVTNGHVRRDGPFPRLFLPAWANDVGLSIGAVASVLAQSNVRLRLPTAYFGSPLDVDAVPALARERGLSCSWIADPAGRAAAAIEAGQIVGWAQGRAEVGPRALGNRSILAHAADPHMRHDLNRRKRRESWRPFGVSLLREELSAGTTSAEESPFMNITVAGLGPAYASALHVDGSCRVHTVSSDDNPPFAELLREMKARTGTAAVINTSLNGPRQPIARTAAECLDTYVALGLDALFIGHYRVSGVQGREGLKVDRRSVVVQHPFDLIVPYEDDDSVVLRSLRHTSSSVTLRPDLLVLSGAPRRHEDMVSARIAIYNPWYNAVFRVTLPRVAAWALEKVSGGASVVVVDKAGDMMNIQSDATDAVINELYLRPTTDVEGHFLRSMATLSVVKAADNPWFPATM